MYHYTISGLNYVYLRDGYQIKETPYGTGVSFSDAEQLDRAIAYGIIKAPMRLRGKEVRFIRSLIGQSQKDFAEELGVKRITVARWEGKPDTAIPGSADRLLRLLFAHDMCGPEAVDTVRQALDEIDPDTEIVELTMAYTPATANAELPGIVDHSREGWSARIAA